MGLDQITYGLNWLDAIAISWNVRLYTYRYYGCVPFRALGDSLALSDSQLML